MSAQIKSGAQMDSGRLYLSDKYVARGPFLIFFDWHHPKESRLHRIKKNLTPYLPTYYPISFEREQLGLLA